MNIDKTILIGGGCASLILIIENMAYGDSYRALLFLEPSQVGFVLIVCILIGMAMGYSLKGVLSKKNNADNDDYDF